MYWLLKSPVHQQPWYWPCRKDNLYCSSRVTFISLGQPQSNTRFKIWNTYSMIFKYTWEWIWTVTKYSHMALTLSRFFLNIKHSQCVFHICDSLFVVEFFYYIDMDVSNTPPTHSRRYFETHVRPTWFLNFHFNFAEVFSRGSNWLSSIIDSANGLPQVCLQTHTWATCLEE